MDTTQPVPEDVIAPRTLRRQLARRNATTAQLLDKQRPKPYRRFEREHFGDLWQGDAMHGPRLPDPAHPDQVRQVFLFAFLDDHTRLIPHAQFYWNEQLPRMEDCFKGAILRHGRPLSVYVDRGKVYTSKQFDTICATLGVQRILGTPYYPEGRGKIERFFQFVQSDFLARGRNLAPVDPGPSQRVPPGLAGGRLPPQGALRDRPGAPGAIPPGSRAFHPLCGPHRAAAGLPPSRAAQGDDDGHLPFPRATATASPTTCAGRRWNCATTPST
jgi:transposase InsO family protein